MSDHRPSAHRRCNSLKFPLRSWSRRLDLSSSFYSKKSRCEVGACSGFFIAGRCFWGAVLGEPCETRWSGWPSVVGGPSSGAHADALYIEISLNCTHPCVLGVAVLPRSCPCLPGESLPLRAGSLSLVQALLSTQLTVPSVFRKGISSSALCLSFGFKSERRAGTVLGEGKLII